MPVTLYGIIMKKTFNLTHPKIKVPRLVEAIKHEVKKYIKRERRKPLPPNVDYWDFDCRYGVDEASSEKDATAGGNQAGKNEASYSGKEQTFTVDQLA